MCVKRQGMQVQMRRVNNFQKVHKSVGWVLPCAATNNWLVAP